jgi:hypothetical protein
MGNALHPKREKLTDFHDTFEDLYDELFEVLVEVRGVVTSRDGPRICNICKASRRGAIVSVFSGHRVRV